MVQVKSKQRVADHGEVFTAPREVKAMLNLVQKEAMKIESRFLEPACGDGNFLVEILHRKLATVESLYGRHQSKYERYALIAVCSLYGIDILKDNVQACRNRLFNIFNEQYVRLFKNKFNKEYQNSIKHILNLNIIWGNALDLSTANKKKSPIVFAEWSLGKNGMIKRSDYMLSFLISQSQVELFADTNILDKSPLEYPPVHFLDLGKTHVTSP